MASYKHLPENLEVGQAVLFLAGARTPNYSGTVESAHGGSADVRLSDDDGGGIVTIIRDQRGWKDVLTKHSAVQPNQ